MRNYDVEILKALLRAGSDGMSVRHVARYVYNACNSFFEPLSYDEVHRYVTSYLTRNAKKADSVVEKGAGWGLYRFNRKSSMARQLILDFDESGDSSDIQQANTAGDDTSLSLF